jgi:hypothetical protein
MWALIGQKGKSGLSFIQGLGGKPVSFLSVVLLGLFTLAVIRLLAARATLSLRTVFAFLVLGMLLGPSSLQVTSRFIDPYGAWGNGFSRNLLILWVSHVVILLPVFVYFFRRRVRTAASVADAFLLGFAVGFGYDWLLTLTAGVYATQRIQQIALFPPFTLDAGGFTLAGDGYWCALGALAMAIGLRFLRNRYVVFSIAGIVILFFAAEEAALIQPAGAPGHWFGAISGRGAFTPWLALVALVVCSFLESRWVNRLVPGDAQKKLQVLSEWQALLNSLLGRKFEEFRQSAARIRLERNVEIARAEVVAHGEDAGLKKELDYVEERLRGVSTAVEDSTADGALVMRKAKQRSLQIALTLALVTVWFLLPLLPESVGAWFWSSQLFHYPLPGLGLTILNALLAGAIVWRYLAAPAWPSAKYDPDELLDYRGEALILKIALGLVLVAILYGAVGHFYNFSYSAPSFTGIGMPGWNGTQLTTCVLLLAAWGSGLWLHRESKWKEAALEVRRASAIHNAIVVLESVFVIWAALAFFGQMQNLTHQKLGAWLYNTFGPAGNSAGDVLGGILTGVFTYGVVKGMRSLGGRAERFLTAPPAPRAMEAAGAGR